MSEAKEKAKRPRKPKAPSIEVCQTIILNLPLEEKLVFVHALDSNIKDERDRLQKQLSLIEGNMKAK